MRNDELNELVEKSLGSEPDYRLPADFARKVTVSVIRREQWKTDLQEYLLLTAIMIGIVTAAAVSYYLLDKDMLIRTFNFFESRQIQVASAIFLVNFILFADKVLLRLLFSRIKNG